MPTLICCLAGALAAARSGAAGIPASPAASPPTGLEQGQIVFPTSAPASPAEGPQARRLKLILASRVKLLAAVGENSQPRAKAVLLALQQASLDTLSELSEDKDPEVRQAAMEMLNKFSVQCRVARAMAMLEPAQSQELQELREKYPALVAQLLGDNMTARIAALKKLVSMKDPCLAEPLLTMCLWHSYRPLRTAAAEIVADKEYGSDELIDALTDIVVDGIRRGFYNGYNGGGNAKSAETFAMQALYRLHPQRAAGKVFAAMQVAPYYLNSDGADLLVRIDQKRLVPVLLAGIQSTHRAATPQSAWMLDVLLRLTNQSPSEYGIQHDNLNPMMGGGGTFQVQNWRNATSKLDEWWKKNKDTPAYRDLKPLPIPKLPALTNPDEENFVITDEGEELQDVEIAAVDQPREAADSSNSPGSTAATGPSADADLYDTAGLEAQIRRLVTSCADGMRSERPKERSRAREAILAVEQSILDAVVQARSDSQAHVLPMLTALAVRCEMAARLVGLSESDRHKVAQYALHHALIVEEFFSPVWSQQAQAIAKMQGQSDPMGEAEPLVAMAMKHPWPALRNRAITLTVGKNDHLLSPYHGQAVVDALCDLLSARLVVASSNTRFFRRARINQFNNRDDYVNEEEVLKALRQIKSKRAAPILLSMMVARSDPFSYQSNFNADAVLAVLAQTLAATGETRAIPLLVELLQGSDTRLSSMPVDNKMWSFSNRDNALYALLLLTGQSPRDYKLMVRTQGDDGDQTMIGFATAEDRKAAVEKFQNWWREHQDLPPYKDLKPLAVPITNSGNPYLRQGF